MDDLVDVAAGLFGRVALGEVRVVIIADAPVQVCAVKPKVGDRSLSRRAGDDFIVRPTQPLAPPQLRPSDPPGGRPSAPRAGKDGHRIAAKLCGRGLLKMAIEEPRRLADTMLKQGANDRGQRVGNSIDPRQAEQVIRRAQSKRSLDHCTSARTPGGS